MLYLLWSEISAFAECASWAAFQSRIGLLPLRRHPEPASAREGSAVASGAPRL